MGDIVQVDKDSFFPADLLLLAVPENVEGIAYVETINLDGESNLKIKKALDETQDLKPDTLSDLTVGHHQQWKKLTLKVYLMDMVGEIQDQQRHPFSDQSRLSAQASCPLRTVYDATLNS